MANEKVIIRRGPSTTLPNEKVPGTIYITTDTGEMYVDDTADSRVRVNTQADYTQNDSTAADYIKNRPFYSEISEATFLDGTFDFVENSGAYAYSQQSSLTFEEGKTYTVVFDVTSYSCTGYIPGEGAPFTILGNASLLDPSLSGGNNEPFIILSEDLSEGRQLIIATNLTGASHAVKITGPKESIKKIDSKYLPDEIYTAIDTKMDKENPTGTGSFSLNRKASTTIGDRSFAEGYSTTASGRQSHAEGNDTTASGASSHAEGSSTTASGADSHAEGYYAAASGQMSHAEGSGTTASGSYSHAEGNDTTASGLSSHAEGNSATASGTHSHAEGASLNKFSSIVTATNPTNDDIITAWNSKKFSLAKGSSSHVEGENSLALGNYSHAEGNSTTASGPSSHAEGWSTTASGADSHAEGNGTTALGVSSHAEGYNAKASSGYQHVQGKYNIEDSAGTYADIIGNGTGDSACSNAATVDWSGNAWYAGDVYVGSTSGTNKDAGSKKLATEDYVNSIVIDDGSID